MDGNRRWARKRLLPVAMGHKKGAETFRERVSDLAKLGVKHATFYALSTENLQRDSSEVSNLLRLFESQLDDLRRLTNEDDIRLAFIGDLSVFDDKLRSKIEGIERDCADNRGLVCRLAVNYGAKAELLRAAKLYAANPTFNHTVTKAACDSDFDAFENCLYTADAPPVDLIIRTGGEKRLSNFLLWQTAYAELYFVDTLWCDFNKDELTKALNEYAARNRRHGK